MVSSNNFQTKLFDTVTTTLGQNGNVEATLQSSRTGASPPDVEVEKDFLHPLHDFRQRGCDRKSIF